MCDLIVHGRDRSVANCGLLGRVEGDDRLHECIEQFLDDVVRHVAWPRDVSAELVEFVDQHEDDLRRGRHEQHVGRTAVVHCRVRAHDVANLGVAGAEGGDEERPHQGTHAEKVDGADQVPIEERVLVVRDGNFLARFIAFLQCRRRLGKVLYDGVLSGYVQLSELGDLGVGQLTWREREPLVRRRLRFAQRCAQLRLRERHAPDVDRVNDGCS